MRPHPARSDCPRAFVSRRRTFHRDVFEESGRNLRSLFILSVARLVALRGTSPDRVRVLVVTKDQWSLRLNTEFRFDQARLDVLSFQFAEHNLAGRNKRLSFDFGFDPGAIRSGCRTPTIESGDRAIS